MIEIQNLYQKTLSQIIEFLEKQEQPFKIYIPKQSVLFNSSNQDIAYDYARLSFCGQLLNENAQKLEYSEVQPHQHDSVQFIITTYQLEKLATVILNISFGYVNELDDEFYDSEDVFEFDEYLGQFLNDVKEDKIKPVCKFFSHTYLKYSEE